MQTSTIDTKKKPALLKVIQLGAMLAIQCYRYTISPVLHTLCGPQSGCRFHPTCSRYAYECYRKHNPLRASFYTLRRVFRCNPTHPGGHDPIP